MIYSHNLEQAGSFFEATLAKSEPGHIPFREKGKFERQIARNFAVAPGSSRLDGSFR